MMLPGREGIPFGCCIVIVLANVPGKIREVLFLRVASLLKFLKPSIMLAVESRRLSVIYWKITIGSTL